MYNFLFSYAFWLYFCVYILRNGVSGPCVTFGGVARLFSNAAAPSYILVAGCENSPSPHPHQCLSSFFLKAIFMGVLFYPVSFDLHFPEANNVELFSLYLLALYARVRARTRTHTYSLYIHINVYIHVCFIYFL